MNEIYEIPLIEIARRVKYNQIKMLRLFSSFLLFNISMKFRKISFYFMLIYICFLNKIGDNDMQNKEINKIVSFRHNYPCINFNFC